MAIYAEKYGYFFKSKNLDRTYNADSFEEWMKPFFKTGVFEGELQVIANIGMTVIVTAGHANLNGKPAFFKSANTLELSVASGVYGRYDTIVIRRNNTERYISLEVVTGTPGSNPKPTPPTRTADIYEIVLAQIYVGVGVQSITQSAITDTRMNSTLCGYVASTVEEIDFNQIYEQYAAWVAEKESDIDDWTQDEQEEFLEWFQEMKDQLSEDAAGHLQSEIDDIEDKIDEINEHFSHIGMVIHSTTLDTEAKVKAIYGTNTEWISLSGYVLRGATSGVTPNHNAKDLGSDDATLVSHSHTVNSHRHYVARQLLAESNGSHSHKVPVAVQTGTTGATTQYFDNYKINTTLLSTASAGAHQHYISAHYTDYSAPGTDSQGSSATNANIPNEKNVYIWERVG